MNAIRAGAALLLVCAGIYSARFWREEVPDPIAVSTFQSGKDADQRFTLRISGRDDGCLVTASSSGQGKRPLSLHPTCLEMVPGLVGARWWLERADGSVAFIKDDDRVAVEFAVADGAAFESYAPRQPIMTLLSR